MKFLISFLMLLSISSTHAATRLKGRNDPTPFPLGMEPSKLVGQWNNPSQHERVVITHIHARGDEKEKLFVEIYNCDAKQSQGFMYYTEQVRAYCGTQHPMKGPTFNMCIWKDSQGRLQTAQLGDDGWSDFRFYQ
jgi:hypothetical protein